MHAKEYLNQIRELEYRINEKSNAIEHIRAKLDLHGLSYDKIKIKSQHEDTFADDIDRIIALEKRMEEESIYWTSAVMSITDQILKLPDQLDSKILLCRYVKQMQLSDIAKTLNYSEDYIRHKHGMALQHFEEVYGPF